MSGPEWARKDRQRELDLRNQIWAWQRADFQADVVAWFFGAVWCLSALAGVGLAFGLRQVWPAQTVWTSLACIGLMLLTVLSVLAFSARFRAGFLTRQLAVPALCLFGGFTLALLLGIPR
jgi:hypothetical protein